MIDIDKFSDTLRTNAGGVSKRRCAEFVRRALSAAGANTALHPSEAKDYGPLLERNGFRIIAVTEPERFTAAKGDIVVFQPAPSGNQAGHIQGFDGKRWISDFVQNGFWPGPVYRKEKPSYAVYRP